MALLQIRSPLPLPLAGGWMFGMKLKWWLQRELEPETGAFIRDFFKEHPGGMFVDVGANSGYFTVMASKAGARVISYEPDETSYRFLRKNIRLNRLKDVKTYQAAVSDKEGVANFYIDKPGSVLNSLISETMESKVSTTVPTTPLLIDYDLCKVDVEGAELQVLKGMKYHRTVICEYFPQRLVDMGTTPEDFVSEVQRMGFTIYLLDGRHVPDAPFLTEAMTKSRLRFTNILLRGAGEVT